MRVAARGKFFSVDEEHFHFRGVHLGGSSVTEADLGTIRAAGFTVVSHAAADVALSAAADRCGLRILACQDPALWQRLAGATSCRRRAVVREMAAQLGQLVGPAPASDALLGVALGWGLEPELRASLGPACIRRAVNQLASVLHREYPGLLTTYVAARPTEGSCPEGVDFLTVDLELSAGEELASALSAAHRLVGDRPLVVGRVRVVAGPTGEPAQQVDISLLVDTAIERGAAGTLLAGPPPVAPAALADLNRRTVRDLEVAWPPVSVVVCAYNAEATLEECLVHCDVLDYPCLETLVVDDGSTDCTGVIARAHPRVQVVTLPHGGLSAARNAGYQAARGDLVAFLDSDAYAPPEWAWYLALGASGAGVAGGGGPNVPPPDDPVGAHVVAKSPGGPLPQLVAEDRALHVPGCNMAFYRTVLERLGGFDVELWAASDDLEFGWRVLDAGEAIGYHPAALVWHHRRPGLRPYLRQQRGYGRSQAIIESHYPQRFPAGQRRRRLIRTLRSVGSKQDRSMTFPVAYRTLDWQRRPLLEVAHQWGMPAAVLVACTAPLGLVRPKLTAPAMGAALFVAALFSTDVVIAGLGGQPPERGLRCQVRVASHRLLRPLAFRWGHWSEQQRLRSPASAEARSRTSAAAAHATSAMAPRWRGPTGPRPW